MFSEDPRTATRAFGAFRWAASSGGVSTARSKHILSLDAGIALLHRFDRSAQRAKHGAALCTEALRKLGARSQISRSTAAGHRHKISSAKQAQSHVWVALHFRKREGPDFLRRCGEIGIQARRDERDSLIRRPRVKKKVFFLRWWCGGRESGLAGCLARRRRRLAANR